jgi:fatty-acyl-CoA synthase
MQVEFSVGAMLTKRAQLDPDKAALIFEGNTFSFRELNERSNRWANAFEDLGVRKGERVGILLRNRNEFLESFFGLAKIGAIVVLLNWRLTPRELECCCKASGIVCLVYEEEFAHTVEELRPNMTLETFVCLGQLSVPKWAKDLNFIGKYPATEPKVASAGNDSLVIAYTSGTTGHSKGVVLTHNIMLWYALSWLWASDISSQDRILAVAPLCHMFGFFCPAILDVYKGCTTVLMRTFEPQQMLETIQKEKITMLLCTTVMLKRLSEIPNFERQLVGVRIIVGAGVLGEQLLKTCVERGISLRTTYGLSEMGCVSIETSDEKANKPGTAGQSFFHTEIRIVDEKSSEVALGGVGELLVKGPTVMREYWKDPESTAETIRDGWLYTGDLARMDRDGYLYIVGRKSDMIFSGGEKIYPGEVESVLETHPKIAEVAVFGLPDETWGESACAVIRLKAGQKLAAQEVAEYCHGRLARFKIPKRIVCTEQLLPRNQLGKIDKKRLRDQQNRSQAL